MAIKEPLPGFLLVGISLIVAFLFATVVQPISGRWDAVLFVIVLFFLLWAIASKRGWSTPYPLPFIRPSVVSELLFGTTHHDTGTGRFLVNRERYKPNGFRYCGDPGGSRDLRGDHDGCIGIPGMAVIVSFFLTEQPAFELFFES